MGRKRKDKKKKRITISVDEDILKFLIEHEINRSVLFTNAANICIKEYSENSKTKSESPIPSE